MRYDMSKNKAENSGDSKFPVTPAIRVLRKFKTAFEQMLYDYTGKGGVSAEGAQSLGIDEHQIIKTIVMEDENNNPLIILMHGDMEISTKNIARIIGTKRITPCTHEKVEKITGYKTGGCTPFGTKNKLPVYVEKTILDYEDIFINGGKRGFILKIKSADLVRILKPVSVEVGI